MFYWYTAKYKNFEICRILLISSRFPEVLDTLARVTVDFWHVMRSSEQIVMLLP